MVHLVYLDDKEKELIQILSGQKNMVIRGLPGAKSPIAGFLKGKPFILWRKALRK